MEETGNYRVRDLRERLSKRHAVYSPECYAAQYRSRRCDRTDASAHDLSLCREHRALLVVHGRRKIMLDVRKNRHGSLFPGLRLAFSKPHPSAPM